MSFRGETYFLDLTPDLPTRLYTEAVERERDELGEIDPVYSAQERQALDAATTPRERIRVYMRTNRLIADLRKQKAMSPFTGRLIGFRQRAGR
jgi:hypothetical protein